MTNNSHDMLKPLFMVNAIMSFIIGTALSIIWRNHNLTCEDEFGIGNDQFYECVNIISDIWLIPTFTMFVFLIIMGICYAMITIKDEIQKESKVE